MSNDVCGQCNNHKDGKCHRLHIPHPQDPKHIACSWFSLNRFYERAPIMVEPVTKSMVHVEPAQFEADVSPTEMFAHQIEAIERFKRESVIALFLEQGCGKSAILLRIAAYKYKRKEIDALLIIAPNSVHRQWHEEQVPLWLDVPYECQCLFGRGGARTAYPFQDPDKLHVVCVNIDTFSTPSKWKDIVEWANSRKTFIALDEATTIKSVTSQRSQRVLYAFNDVIRNRKVVLSSKVKSVARAILTGTPVTNGPNDLWALLEFVQPNFFNRNWFSFKNYYGMYTDIDVEVVLETGKVKSQRIKVLLNEDRWQRIKLCQSWESAFMLFGVSQDTYMTVQMQSHYQGPYKHADELKAQLDKVAIFKLLKDCVDMPEQNYITKHVLMNDETNKVYNEMRDELIAEYDDTTATALNKITALIRLQQISSGFIVGERDIPSMYEYDENDPDVVPGPQVRWIGASNPKLEALYNDIAESNMPCIIVTHFSCEAARIYDDLSKKYRCCLMTGWKREGTIEEFKEGKYDIMVANIRVISRGFNLQNSCAMFFYSNTFSLEDRLQVEGRIFRLGQKQVCKYVDYVYDDTVDEQVVSALVSKKNLLDYIRGVNIKQII